MTEQTPNVAPGLPDPNLTATLTYAEWCTVMRCIAAAPYRDVAQIVDRLLGQIGPQADAQQSQAALAMAPTASQARN